MTSDEAPFLKEDSTNMVKELSDEELLKKSQAIDKMLADFNAKQLLQQPTTEGNFK